jgi:hypothetical protein
MCSAEITKSEQLTPFIERSLIIYERVKTVLDFIIFELYDLYYMVVS